MFFGDHQHLADSRAFNAFLKPLKKAEWVVYAKQPFGGPNQVLDYLSRYTHRVAISNSRLITADEHGVTFKVKDYRRNGPDRYKTMTLPAGEFIRRFLIHVLPKGFHRIRHYGLLANGNRVKNIARARELLAVPDRHEPDVDEQEETDGSTRTCPDCGGRMITIEIFEAGQTPQYRPMPEGIDSS